MSLGDWLRNGWLTEHDSSAEEIRDLLGVTDRDLADARTPGLSADWRLGIAYNAALQASAAALAASGYRAARDAYHYRVIQSLAFTIGSSADLVGKFDAFRKKRNLGGYERAGLASTQEAEEMIALSTELRASVEQWIRKEHPNLIR
jgi:hypothetical protein